MSDTQFKKLSLVPMKKKPLGDDAETRYWKSFQVNDLSTFRILSILIVPQP